MSALIVPPLPAPSRPSKITMTRRPLCFTHSWSWQSSTCSRRSSFAYSLLESLPFASAFFAAFSLDFFAIPAPYFGFEALAAGSVSSGGISGVFQPPPSAR